MPSLALGRLWKGFRVKVKVDVVANVKEAWNVLT